MQVVQAKRGVQKLARAGYASKGIVYMLLGVLAFMAAFELGSASADASRGGVFKMVRDAPAGGTLLLLLAVGLFGYVAWRMVQAFAPAYGHEHKKSKRALYFLSGLGYAGVAVAALNMALGKSSSGGGNSQQTLAATLLDKPGGQWLVGIVALIMLGTGIYQLYYGWTEQYRKHVNEGQVHTPHASLLVRSGKVGYIARGIVWIILAYLLLRAAMHANASEAGDTSEAFQFLEGSPMGSYLLGAVGLGFVAYGIFNFLRARYERF
ncbi:DUF1206 domain-containing protein [Paracnuella aquatica]|uniref:DUF1206 domain-containing protein n=1 Tax=Paracnuella aquatica TaxID=2268757 RepID=UPI000DEF8B66|nr:DUF1206 domain-containing protein [Paracnuella aquatica]RPD43843.1 DUF1206 domain-containing protein [Paracnuella aquatica]